MSLPPDNPKPLANDPVLESHSGGEPDSFLQRWSERKQQARSDTDIPATTLEPSRSIPTPVQAQQELTDADMPPIESLGEDSDFSSFFSSKVSAELRRVALRKLFHLPAYNITDGLNDYDEDYTHFAKLGDVVTADMRHMMALEARREEERQQALQSSSVDQSEAALVDSPGGDDENVSEPPGDGLLDEDMASEELADEALADGAKSDQMNQREPPNGSQDTPV